MILRNEYLALKRKAYMICCGTYVAIAPFIVAYTNINHFQVLAFSSAAVIAFGFFLVAWKWPKQMIFFEVTMVIIATLVGVFVPLYSLMYMPQFLFKVKHWSLISYLFYFFALGSKAGLAVSLLNLASVPLIIAIYTFVSDVPQVQFIEWQLAQTVMVVLSYYITSITEKHTMAIQDVAQTDSLTRLPNRMRLEEALRIEFLRAERYRRPLSVVLFDIDLFKGVNDKYGHRSGDDVLCGISVIAASKVRSTDLLGRWGGEEFLLLCPETDVTEAYNIAERIRSSLDVHSFLRIGTVTCSFGVTAYQPGDSISRLLDRVDTALYLAKDRGRNRLEMI